VSTNTPETPGLADRPDTTAHPGTPARPDLDETTPMTNRPATERPHEESEVLRPTERTQTLAPPSPQPAPVVRGPYVAPVILGLVCLVIAAAAFAQELANWTINWGDVGPLGIVVAGVVLVLLGGLGLLSSRRRRR
jgi:hypothetical protein